MRSGVFDGDGTAAQRVVKIIFGCREWKEREELMLEPY